MKKILRLTICLAAFILSNAVLAVNFPVTITTEEATLDNWTSTGTDLALNTWSTENDESGMVTPFVQAWVSAGGTLADGAISHKQITGLTPGSYTVKLFVRAFNENNTEVYPSGISFYANSTSVDLDSVGTKSIYNTKSTVVYASLSVDCKVGEDSTLNIGLNVANATCNWVAFKNLEIIQNLSTPPVINPVVGKMGTRAAQLQQDALDEYESNPTPSTYKMVLGYVENAQKSIDFYAPIVALDATGQKAFAYYDEFVAGTLDETKDYTNDIIAAAEAQVTPGADLSYVVLNTKWNGTSGTYKNGYEKYSKSALKEGLVIYQSLTNLTPGIYELKFYAVANNANIVAPSGSGIAQVFANGVAEDIDVIKQNSCVPEDYLRTFKIIVENDGCLDYGLVNIAEGGNWYVAQAKSLTLIQLAPSLTPDNVAVMKYKGASNSSMAATGNAASVNLNADEWEVEASSGSISTMPALNGTNKQIRLYGSSNGEGNSITVSSSEYTIDSISMKYAGEYGNAEILVNDEAVTSDNGSYIIGESSFTITNINTDLTQVRIDSVMIYYKKTVEPETLGTASYVRNDSTISIAFPEYALDSVVSTAYKYSVSVKVTIDDNEPDSYEATYSANTGINIPLSALYTNVAAGSKIAIEVAKGNIKLYDAYNTVVANNFDTITDTIEIPYPEMVVNGITYAIKSENLFVNGSFENGVDGWKTLGYATEAKAENFVLTTEGGYDNGAFITTSASGAGSETSIRQAVAVEPGKTYYFRTYTSGKAPSAQNYNYNGLFKMKDASTENGLIKAFEWPQGAETTATEWSMTEYIFTAQEDNPYVGVRMSWNSESSFDGFYLVEISQITSPLDAAKTNALNTLAALSPIGDELFYYSQDSINATMDSINAATTLEQLEAITFPKVNAPLENEPYVVANTIAEGNLTIADDKVSVDANSYVFFTAVDGGFIISNINGEFVYKTTANTWTFATTTDTTNAYVVTVIPVEGGYTISGANGLFGTDDTTAGSTVYANKTAAQNGIWTIEQYIEPDPEPIEPDAIATIATGNKEGKVKKAISRGTVVILKNGKKYNAAGELLK